MSTPEAVARGLRVGKKRSLIPYLSLCAFWAVAAELMMEICEFGFEFPKPLLSLRHELLASSLAITIATLAFCVARLAQQAPSARDLKRRLRFQLEALPFKGKGWNFVTLTFGVTFAFGALAQTGELDPDFDRDAIGWLCSALAVAMLMALIARWVLHRLPDFVAAVLAFFIRVVGDPCARYIDRTGDAIRVAFEARPPNFFSRPPPTF